MIEFAAETFRTVAQGAALPNDHVVTCYLDERQRRISIARIAGHLYAFDDLCTCAGRKCALSGGLFTGTTLVCRHHGSRFDIVTGAVIEGPATEPLEVYDVQEVAGSVRIRISERQ